MQQEMTARQTNGDAEVAEAADRRPVEITLRAAAFGEIMSILLQSPRHKAVPLGVLARQMVPAFLTNQYILARAKPDNASACYPGGCRASVSDEVGRRLQANSTKPIDLAAEEWQSGDTVWILDIVAASRVSAALLRSVREKVGAGRTIKFRTTDAHGTVCVRTIT